MTTQCYTPDLFFEPLGQRDALARVDGGAVTSDAGGLLLREVEAKFGFLAQFARYFTDHRDPQLVEHTLPELLKQRIFGLCLGYVYSDNYLVHPTNACFVSWRPRIFSLKNAWSRKP
jgi:hypothetical protein